MMSDRETCCKVTSEDLKNCQKTRGYPDNAPKQVWDQSTLDSSSVLFRHQEEKKINLYAENIREYTMPRDQEGTRIRGWIPSNVRLGPVSDIKVCKTLGRYSVEAQVPSLFEDQTTSWIRIVSGVEKYVREAMPIDIEVQRSRDPHCFQMSRFITQLLRHKEVGREEGAGVPYARIVEKCKEVLSEDSRYWSDEVKQKLNMAPHWSAEKLIDVLSKGGGQKKRFQ